MKLFNQAFSLENQEIWDKKIKINQVAPLNLKCGSLPTKLKVPANEKIEIKMKVETKFSRFAWFLLNLYEW